MSRYNLGPVDRRSAIHAALGEPVRLAIVDRLVCGDASPGELAETLEMAGNLLAHHLQVLQDAGVIRRVRSDGDRRRSYVQLCLEDETVWSAARLGRDSGAVPMGGRPRVVFVCTANSARSQLAAARWNAISAVPAASAGTHPAARVHPRALSTGRRHGLRLGRAKPVGIEDFLHQNDLVIAVCDAAHEELGADRPRWHWSIPDPARVDTDEAFETAFTDIALRVERLAGSISVPVQAQRASARPRATSARITVGETPR